LDRLRKANLEPGQWMTTGRDSSAAFFSPLNQINISTVSRLGFAWEYKTDTYRGMEATPLVVDGVLYVSGTWGSAYAIDAATGAPKWTFDPHSDSSFDASSARWAGSDVTSRGLQIWQGKVFTVATDCTLYALDVRDGHILWKTQTLAEKIPGYACSGAPQIAGRLVVVGNAGGDNLAGGIRGYVSAFDLSNGKLVWRFYTVPKLGDPQPTPELARAAETWDPKRDASFGGGGTVWGLMAYDPDLQLLFFGTGNAAPYDAKRDWSGGTSTDRLYAASIIALHATNGRMAWYYQATPGDMWDYDAVMNVVLARLTINGKSRRVLMQANKNGYFYVLDRENGHPLSVRSFVPMNWSTGVDRAFRPIVSRDVDYSASPKVIYPSGFGAHTWPPMSYSETTGLVYIPAIEAQEIFVDVRTNPYSQLSDVDQTTGIAVIYPDRLLSYPLWESVLGPLPRFPSLPLDGRPRLRGALKAWDPVAGKVVWEQQTSQDYMLIDGGVLSTAGGLVFAGREDGHFIVYDAESGAILKDLVTGSPILAAPMTYSVDGFQYVSVLCGHGGSNYFFLGTAGMQYVNEGRVLTFALGGAPDVPRPAARAVPSPYPPPPARTGGPELINAGRDLFFNRCSRCHTLGVPAITPDLSRSNVVASLDALQAVLLKGVLQPYGMPRFSDVLGPADVEALQSYFIDQWWRAYATQNATAVKPLN
jgi:quinohemoprotein ethanol dehydrogenase